MDFVGVWRRLGEELTALRGRLSGEPAEVEYRRALVVLTRIAEEQHQLIGSLETGCAELSRRLSHAADRGEVEDRIEDLFARLSAFEDQLDRVSSELEYHRHPEDASAADVDRGLAELSRGLRSVAERVADHDHAEDASVRQLDRTDRELKRLRREVSGLTKGHGEDAVARRSLKSLEKDVGALKKRVRKLDGKGGLFG